ncbi:hypothetical protein BS50DRAFT_280012 [Corynespora cassiicola Philippines]|uniref:Uncharacterized protein n=1 Tax=Corynespora cassiicola Philippines TaxID=1448308 RepID=A0A2T2P0Z6_CORCC|nr:hypothetical protein BS50DRAFT_280012 [Corynespora cassiicola Philippines]
MPPRPRLLAPWTDLDASSAWASRSSLLHEPVSRQTQRHALAPQIRRLLLVHVAVPTQCVDSILWAAVGLLRFFSNLGRHESHTALQSFIRADTAALQIWHLHEYSFSASRFNASLCLPSSSPWRRGQTVNSVIDDAAFVRSCANPNV